MKKLIVQYFRAYEERLVSLVEQEMAEGEFPTVDPVATVIALEGLYEGILLLWAFDPTHVDLSRQIQAAVRLLVEGLRESEVNKSRG